MTTLHEIKTALRNGPYAWPGGYPLFFITTDGGALGFSTVRENWQQVVWSHLHDCRDGWHLAGVDVNWENPDLFDDHTGERIESAYAEPE